MRASPPRGPFSTGPPATTTLLSSRVPTDGSVHALCALLDRLDGAGGIDALTIHTPDLDDLSYALRD
jgi:hypothetical protein